MLTVYFSLFHRPSKATIAEHLVYLTKKRLYLFLQSTGVSAWEIYISQICDNLNQCAIDALGGISPASVTPFTEYKVRLAREKNQKHKYLDYHQQEQNVNSFELKTPAQRKLNLGDVVFKTLKHDPMGKSYNVRYGTMFLVTKILAAKDPIRYGLVHLNGAPVEGTFYEQQLIKCPIKPDKDTFYLIKPQDVYKERTVKGEKQIYVQYLYYPANQGEWIWKKDIESASKINE